MSKRGWVEEGVAPEFWRNSDGTVIMLNMRCFDFGNGMGRSEIKSANCPTCGAKCEFQQRQCFDCARLLFY